jgi:aminomethyltransferase
MGYVEAVNSVAGTTVSLLVRGVAWPARIVPMPFVPHRYYRG